MTPFDRDQGLVDYRRTWGISRVHGTALCLYCGDGGHKTFAKTCRTVH